MKQRIVVLTFVAVSLVALPISTVLGGPKGVQVKVKGEVVDLWCYLEDGSHGGL